MMQLYLPTHVGERYEIVKKLRKLDVLVAGWERVPIEQLRDICQAEEEKARNKVEKEKPAPKYSRKEIGATLNDLLKFQRARKEGRKRLY